MQLVLVLVSVMIMAGANGISLPKMPKPKLDVITFQNKSDNKEILKPKLPEERRKLSVFPKSNKKFVVIQEPNLAQTVDLPTRATKKPLMKKILPQNKDLPNGTKDETLKPILDAHLPDLKRLRESQDMNRKFNNDDSVEVIEDMFEVREETNTIIEKVLETTMNPLHKEGTNAEDRVLAPTDPKEDKTRQKRLLHLQENNVKVSQESEETVDFDEFIFLNPSKRSYEHQNSGEESEECTTDVTADAKAIRVKRRDNVIEEENLGTTMSGYRFTWRDTKLTNNLVFKNINS